MRRNLKKIKVLLTGDVDGLRGDVTGLRGDVDSCEITKEEREKGINIEDLIPKSK